MLEYALRMERSVYSFSLYMPMNLPILTIIQRFNQLTQPTSHPTPGPSTKLLTIQANAVPLSHKDDSHNQVAAAHQGVRVYLFATILNVFHLLYLDVLRVFGGSVGIAYQHYTSFLLVFRVSLTLLRIDLFFRVVIPSS